MSAGDVRLGQRWSRPQRLRNALWRSLIRAALTLGDAVPGPWLVRVGALLGGLVGWLWPNGRRRAAAALLAKGEDRARVAATFRAAGANLARCLLLRRAEVPVERLAELDPAALRLLADARAEGRGVLLVGSHQGPFEAAAAVLAGAGFAPVVLVRESYDPALDPLVDAHRLGRGLELVHRGRPDAPRRLLRALHRGRVVALLADLPARVPSLTVERLGYPVTVPLGPARLAALTGCAVLAGGLVPSGERFRLELERVEPTGDAAADTRALQAALGRVIRRAGADYPWMALPLPPAGPGAPPGRQGFARSAPARVV